MLGTLIVMACGLAADPPSVSNYASIQAALDANPNRMVFVPPGDHVINQKLRLGGERAGLYGPGRIIQENPDEPIIELENARNAEIRDLTLTRPEGKSETRTEGILAIRCHDLVIENVRVVDNRTVSGAITLRDCRNARISHCVVRNYMRVAIDDRTASPDWGYAFHCTDGTGISVAGSSGTAIEGNRIVEERLLPTRELKARFKLGEWVKKNPQRGKLVNPATWEAGTTENWQQGSGIIVTSPEVSDGTRILGNHIENAAQGIDLHADHVIVAQNLVVNAFIGMKAMHGSRNVLITGNQFTRNSLWAIGLMPGAASHAGNTDGGSIIAHNIISDFGHGDAHWIWGDDRAPIRFDTGQHPDDPPLADVVIQGNVVQALGAPRYRYAILVPGGPAAPRGLHFSGNLLTPGTSGASNVELRP